MNKSLKIILIFLGVFALLFGLLMLGNELSKGPGTTKRKVSKFQELSKTIPMEWHTAKEWKRDLFDEQVELLDGFKFAGKLSEGERSKLLELIGISVDDIIDSLFNVEMASPESNERKVQANGKGLVFLRAFEDERTKTKPYAKASYIDSHFKMYQAYNAALNFARKNFAVSASVKDDFTWSSFEAIRAGWDRERAEIQSGQYYASHFSRINVVRRGWNDYASKVDNAKQDFYVRLEENLKSAVNNRSRELQAAADRLIQQSKDGDATVLPSLRESEEDWIKSVDEFVRLISGSDTSALSRLRNQAGSNSTIYRNISNIINRIPSDAEEWKDRVKKALHP